ncbi:MAG TPA: chitobiase/beta-hexosaminidase C-terminal domain-containing protein, partial [Sumerlaeia bacterium]|nr:chitobiase/beta-hexosaminidase C-terminal domain-containing protein [Sumerlaeia bacterium]
MAPKRIVSAVFTAGLLLACGTNVARGAAAAPSSPVKPPAVMPPPRRLTVGEGITRLPEQIAISVSSDATDTEKYAAEMLQKDLQRLFGFRASIGSDAREASIVVGVLQTNKDLAELATPAIRATLDHMPRTPGYFTEGYVIGVVEKRGEPKALVVGADKVGVMYGCFTLIQLFSKRDGRLCLPSSLDVEDYPVMKRRGYAFYADEVETLDRMARWRLNALGYRQFLPWRPPPGGWTEDLPEDFPKAVAECRKRGILYYAGTAQRWVEDHWRKHPEEYEGVKFSTKDERCVALMKRLWDQLGAAGVDGFLLMLDDISQNMPAEDLGREHVKWVRMMKEAADRHGVQRLLMCPTHYWKGWKADYYKPFREATDLADVHMIFCPYDAEEIAAATKAGLQHCEWWHNGAWPLGTGEWTKPAFAGLLGGLVRVEWGWYGEIDCPPELLNELRTVPERTLLGWINGNWPVWGSYAWNPSWYEPEKSERAMAEAQLGCGAAEPYMAVMNHVRGWAQRLTTTEGTAEEFESANAKAKEIVETLKPIIDQTQRPGILPIEDRRNQWWLIDKDLRTLEEKAFPPVIVWDSKDEHDTVEVRAVCRRTGVEMRYTLDGAEPTTDSPIWSKPLPIDRSVTIRIKTFQNGEEKGSASATLHKHDANGRGVSYVKPYAAKYPAGGKSGLTDGVRGSTNSGDGRWQGFEVGDLDAMIDLGREIAVRSI